jgi:hypothetical protein
VTDRWIDRALSPLTEVGSGMAVVRDADGVISPGGIAGDVQLVHNWWELRKAYELSGRRRPPEDGRLVLVAWGAFAADPLPWDIERAAITVVEVRLPGSPLVRRVLAELVSGDADEAERAITAVASSRTPEAALLTSLSGVPLGSSMPSRDHQLRLAIRLGFHPGATEPVRQLARQWVTDPTIVGLLHQPPETADLQDEWNRFVQEAQSPWSTTFARAVAEIGQLFAAGVLQPAASKREVAPWAQIGVRSPSDEERAIELLAERPTPFPPATQLEWMVLAEWWGEVRRLVASAPTKLRSQAWETWEAIDMAFLPWLRNNYGHLLSSASPWPTALHRVADYLARRIRQDRADRVLLVVLDGLGHTQWAHIHRRLTVFHPGSTFALIPTYTTVSRQAIFAGDLPLAYPDLMWTTHRETHHWRAFWEGEGIPVSATSYHRVKGRFPQDRIDFGTRRAVGVVVNAVDDFMHSSELFGDAQILANLDVWLDNGFLVDLVGRATDAGFEVWITSDHGNLECLPTGKPSEGLAAEAAGKRLLRYPNRVLRDASTIEGLTWDNIPGLPQDAAHLKFAGGRLAYTNFQLSVSHGGLSLDEVVVPLVRVGP